MCIRDRVHVDLGGRLGIADVADAGVVDQDVEPTEAAFQLLSLIHISEPTRPY